jgi:hypothetical protein
MGVILALAHGAGLMLFPVLSPHLSSFSTGKGVCRAPICDVNLPESLINPKIIRWNDRGLLPMPCYLVKAE